MKSLVKAFSSPFRSSKTQKTIDNKQPNPPQNPQLQTNIDLTNSNPKTTTKFNLIYQQIQKMVEHLSTALQFKQNMTDDQKRQLIYELSSIALNDQRTTNQLMEEDVLSADDEEEQEAQNHKPTSIRNIEPQKQLTENIQNLKEIDTATQPSEKTSPNNLSPQKQLKEMFQQFQIQELKNSPEKQKPYSKNELSTYGEIKAKMSNFFSQNSFKVFKVMKSSKSPQSQKTSKQSEKQDTNTPQMWQSVVKKQKKKSFISNILPSWGGKKQCKYGSISSSTIVQSKTKEEMNL